MSIDEDRLRTLLEAPLRPQAGRAAIVWIVVGFLVGLLLPRLRSPFA